MGGKGGNTTTIMGEARGWREKLPDASKKEKQHGGLLRKEI